MLLKMRAHGLKFGDTGPLIIQIVNALPPFPYEVNLHCPKRKFEFARATQRRATKYHATVLPGADFLVADAVRPNRSP